MNERYIRHNKSENIRYTPSAPILIEATAIIEDKVQGGILGQVKFKNIQDKKIIAIKINVTSKDILGNILGDKIQQNYLDICERRNSTFGTDKPIVFVDQTTREFEIEVIEVIFEDLTIWNGHNLVFAEIPKQKSISDEITNSEVVKQFHVEYGDNKDYIPLIIHDLWFCNCGYVNQAKEESCYSCAAKFSKINTYDLLQLTEEAIVQAEKDKRERLEKEERNRIVLEAKIKQLKINLKIITITLLVLAMFFTPFWLYKNFFVEKVTYNKALKFIENDQYDDAVASLLKLGNFEDTIDILRALHYDKALEYISNDQLIDGLDLLFELSLENYKDCDKLISEIVIDFATEKLVVGNIMEINYSADKDDIIEVLKILDSYIFVGEADILEADDDITDVLNHMYESIEINDCAQEINDILTDFTFTTDNILTISKENYKKKLTNVLSTQSQNKAKEVLKDINDYYGASTDVAVEFLSLYVQKYPSYASELYNANLITYSHYSKMNRYTKYSK